MWLSLVERHVRDVEAGGSNPLTPTSNISRARNLVRLFFIDNRAGVTRHAPTRLLCRVPFCTRDPEVCDEP